MAEVNTAPVELGTEKIGKLLNRYALPAIVAMAASSLYNMVDSIFIGKGIGSLAISGLAVTFPLMNIASAFGTLVGVGGCTIISILLGQKNYDGANKTISNILTLNVIIGLIVGATALIFLDPILYFFGAVENTVGYAREYLQIILCGNVISHTYFGLNNVMRVTGRPMTAMGLTLFAVISNMILDPLFIFVFKMGIRGAAIATVLCQCLALAYAFVQFCGHNKTLHFVKGIFRLDWRIARDSLGIGVGPFLMNLAACIVSLFVNRQMLKYGGELAVGAFGICNRIVFIFVMICMGFNQGMQPIASYNFGARQYSRVRQVYTKTVMYASIVMIIGFIITMTIPELPAKLFINTKIDPLAPKMLALAARGLRLMNVVVFLIGFQMVSTNFFQCLGMVSKSIILSLSRQVICLIPLLYILPLWFEKSGGLGLSLIGTDGVWLSYPASDLVSFTLTVIMIVPLLRKFGRLQDGEKLSELQEMGPESGTQESKIE